MKQLLMTIALAVLFGQVWAQDADTTIIVTQADTTRTFTITINSDGVEVRNKRDDEDEDDKNLAFDFGIFNGFDIGFSVFLDNGDFNLSEEYENFNLQIKNSSNFNLRLVHAEFKPTKFIALDFGLGLDYNNWELKKDIILLPDMEQVTFEQSEAHFNKNKLKTKYLTVPMSLHFVFSNKITIGGSFEPQFLLRGRVKQVSDEFGKTKVDDDFNFRKFRYALVGRVGYNGFSVFCRYIPKSIFADGKGPELQSISFGLGWGF